MTTFSSNSDFSTDADATVANAANSTAITDWKWETTGSTWSATVTADGAAEGGKYVALAEVSSGNLATLFSMNGPGIIADSTETDILFRYRFSSIAVISNVGRIRSDTVPGVYYTLLVTTAGHLRLQRWAGTSAQQSIGLQVNKGFLINTWYWARINVSAAGSWSWSSWAGAVGDEPGTWDISGITDTGKIGGKVGIGAMNSSVDPVDYDWFSCGTAGDAAPGPVGGLAIPVAMNHYRQLRAN